MYSKKSITNFYTILTDNEFTKPRHVFSDTMRIVQETDIFVKMHFHQVSARSIQLCLGIV